MRQAARAKTWRRWCVYILLALIVLPVLVTTVWYGRQVRQQRLDHALIAAIKKNDTAGAIALLDQGADANATDKPETPLTFKNLLADFWNRIKGNKPPKETNLSTPAILLAYKYAMENDLPFSIMEIPKISTANSAGV